MENLVMRYRQPAKDWGQALPLGNGRMAQMVFGGVEHERIFIDESTFWSGKPEHDNNLNGDQALIKAIRAALFAGDYKRAHSLSKGIGVKGNFGTHLPCGALHIEQPGLAQVTGYERSLDLCNGVSAVRFVSGGVNYERQAFCSHPDDLFVMRVSADKPGALNLYIYYQENDVPAARGCADGDLVFDIRALEKIHSDGTCGVRLRGRARIAHTGGTLCAADGAVRLRGADSAVILLSMCSDFLPGDYRRVCLNKLDAAEERGWNTLFARHLEDQRARMGAVDLTLSGGCPDLPTDERIARVRAGESDPGLAALMYELGRYLLNASSRADSPLPTHLTGIWNDNLACRIQWSCCYTLDINTQMNYWPAGPGALSDCSIPLFTWVRDVLMPSGAYTAKKLYAMRGWTAQIFSNAWGFSAPGPWWIWPMGGVWLCTHLWDHYLFTCDRDFLHDVVWPVMSGAARFCLDYLTEAPDTGCLVPGPAYSPENGFAVDGARCESDMGTTCDVLLIRELIDNCAQAADILDVDGELARQCRDAVKRLPPYRVGKHGQLMEWRNDYDETNLNHRHTSHLLGVFPFSQITPEKTPELAQAAMVSLKRRIGPPEQWGKTDFYQMNFARANWSLISSRLGDADMAYKAVASAMRELTIDNLFVCHAPFKEGYQGMQGVEGWRVYELDGNSGFSASVAEMLLQSHDGVIRLLPALPKEWPDGSVRGLRARGGYSVDFDWRDGKLTRCAVRSALRHSCTVSYAGKTVTAALTDGGAVFNKMSF